MIERSRKMNSRETPKHSSQQTQSAIATLQNEVICQYAHSNLNYFSLSFFLNEGFLRITLKQNSAGVNITKNLDSFFTSLFHETRCKYFIQ